MCVSNLHGVVGVLVVEDQGLLAELVVSLQLVDVGLVVDDVLLILLQVVHLFLQGAAMSTDTWPISCRGGGG